MSEDERTLWCGNLSEKVTEELLYELCLQAGPIENVNIPRHGDKQRSFAFVTYVHACSVEYAMRIFEGSALFKRQLTLDRKIRNGPNPSASPKENFKYPTANGRFSNEPAPMFNEPFARPQNQPDQNVFMFNNALSDGQNSSGNSMMPNNILSAMEMGGVNGLTPELLMLLSQQMLGAELPAYDDNDHQDNSYRTKMKHPERHQRHPYSRDDRNDRNHGRSSYDRNEHRHHHDHGHDKRRHDRDRDYNRRSR